ncbi:MAG: DUF1722 domain-containing protein [Nitrosopumilaceae archaeon]|nr:DUF1722 domain-containing protein [Nitrosopumilaceae archaeon]NIP09946.1 DUF1722 domain-containing protein [Nitrosopumilaceae archaeon]NIS94717.1 DUF1722 domain-containing protein [Nitrosopumilaceae archaeon]
MPKLTEDDVFGYVMERFSELKNEPSIDDLVTFHSNNKYLLMAHNQSKLKILGNLVANHKKLTLKKILEKYESALIETLNCTPTTKTNTNVLMHLFGFFGKHLNQNEKKIFLQFIKDYREDKITLGKVLSEIEPITYRLNNLYLISQTYFLLYAEAKMGNILEMYDPQYFRD